MAIDVSTSTVIARPVAVVARYAGDPSNAPQWYASIESVGWRTPPPLRVGTELDVVAHFLGRSLVYTYVVTGLVEDARLAMRTAQGPFPMETTYSWAAVGPGATRMTLRNQGEPAGFSRLAAPGLASAVRRANRKDLVRIRTLLEARPSLAA